MSEAAHLRWTQNRRRHRGVGLHDDRCVGCGSPLPEGRLFYCDDACRGDRPGDVDLAVFEGVQLGLFE